MNSLGGFALAVQESEEAENDPGASVEITGIIPPSPDSGTGLAGSLGLGVKCKGSEVAVKTATYMPGKKYNPLFLSAVFCYFLWGGQGVGGGVSIGIYPV